MSSHGFVIIKKQEAEIRNSFHKGELYKRGITWISLLSSFINTLGIRDEQRGGKFADYFKLLQLIRSKNGLWRDPK